MFSTSLFDPGTTCPYRSTVVAILVHTALVGGVHRHNYNKRTCKASPDIAVTDKKKSDDFATNFSVYKDLEIVEFFQDCYTLLVILPPFLP